MSVYNIFSMASAKMGLNPSDATQRNTLVRFLNESAFELYIQCDMPGSLMEQVFKVNGDQTIAMPYYVGELRAIREFNSMIPWNINQMRPRYNQSNWDDFWRNWRLKGPSPLQKAITNASVLTVSISAAEATPFTVTVVGQTTTANSVSETFTLSGTSAVGTKDFIDITSITKSAVTANDVLVSDIDGTVLSTVPNNDLKAEYQIYDISTMPWLATSNSSLDHFIEILFKKRLMFLSNDSDEFPAAGWDTILSNKMVQLYLQEQGKVEEALAFDTLVTRSAARKVEETNRATQDKIAFVVNPHDTLNPRIRPRRPGRYGGYGSTAKYGVV